MSIPTVCYCIILPKPLAVLIQLLEQISFLITSILAHLGLFFPSNLLLWTPLDDLGYNLQTDLAPASPFAAASIKMRLRVVEFAGILKRSPELFVGEEPNCAVCLCCLEKKDKVRVLGNCSHVFHKNCIDKWVDQGHVTCPMCRSWLLPQAEGRKNSGWSLSHTSLTRFW